jgi:perosamine synthetase
MFDRIPQFQPFIGNEEYEAIKDCFDSNWITEGPKSKEFVEKLCKFMNVKYGVLACNGTLSIYMALRAVGVGPGDEVIVPNFTFIASANAVEMCGAKPIFVDVRDNLHMNIELCSKLITRKTKAIMPVHIYGMACNMVEVMEFAKLHNLKVVEDAAQAIGVKWSGKQAGTFGDVGSFSFFADKTITTGEGGLVVTNDESIYKELLFIRNQGRIDRGSFIHPKIGYNFRMTDIQSAIGLVQLNKIEAIIEKKSEILSCYRSHLDKSFKIIVPDSRSSHIPFRVCVTILGGNQKMMKHLTENNIETRTFFYPLHKQPGYARDDGWTSKIARMYRRKEEDQFSNSERLYNEGVCLPSFVSISEEQIKYVCEKMNELV